MSDAKQAKQSVVRMAKMIRPLNRFGTENEYRFVVYHSQEWGRLADAGFMTMSVDTYGLTAEVSRG